MVANEPLPATVAPEIRPVPGPPEPEAADPAIGFQAHETAVIEDGVTIGRGTTLWHHCHVRSSAIIGADCVLGKNVYVDAGVSIGDHVKIQNNVSVYQGVTLEDDVFVGPSAVFTNDLRPRATSGAWHVMPTTVRRGASIGANATIVCGVDIGPHAMVGAGSVVTRSVLAHQLVAGNPARPKGWVCSCGSVFSRQAEPPPRAVTCPSCAGGSHRDPPTAEGRRVTLGAPQLGPEEEAAVLAVLRSGQLVAGRWTDRFEKDFAAAHGALWAVAVSNGTVALVAALRALGIGPGDEVITTPLTFAATLNAILDVGATARFADIGDDFLLDPDAVGAAITPRTRAIVPVHLYGLPADLTRLADLAASRGIAVLADAAQAHGATLGGRGVGAFATSAFSFYGSKNITSGEGGIVTTTDPGVAERLRLLRNHGMRDRYDHVLIGSNYRITEMQAAMATVQLLRLADLNQRRRANARRLSAALFGLAGLELPQELPGRSHSWHQYTIRVTPDSPVDRDALHRALDRAGVASRVFYPRLAYDHSCYAGHPQVVPGDTPRAGRFVRQVLSLPVHPGLTSADIDKITTSTRAALEGGRA